ncbi:DUF2637 domain-containing protein [Agromyces binzhouensis]|uniref:DUF2637 domain-containing protein n=1 Tax=Agromyces binzhouensis TaxID=1817495 RepID=UPI0013ED6F65|nr:helix-turn-helix domain-containing protein [Agromyces binzhouensis]
MSARGPQLRAASRSLRIFLGWLIAAAGALAIFMSWGALHDLALHVGGMPADRAIVFPIVVDLPALAAMLIALLVPAPSRFLRALPWFTFTLFSALTVAGNAAAVAIADPDTMILGQVPAVIVNAVPAIALLLTTHLAAATVYRRDDRPDPTVTVRPARRRRPVSTGGSAPAERSGASPSGRLVERAGDGASEPDASVDRPTRVDREAQRTEVISLVDEGASVRSAARTAGVASTTAQRWVERARRDQAPEPTVPLERDPVGVA